jgi:hypothetical protein
MAHDVEFQASQLAGFDVAVGFFFSSE